MLDAPEAYASLRVRLEEGHHSIPDVDREASGRSGSSGHRSSLSASSSLGISGSGGSSLGSSASSSASSSSATLLLKPCCSGPLSARSPHGAEQQAQQRPPWSEMEEKENNEEEDGHALGGRDRSGSVPELVAQVQHLILTLREQHGINCAILGKHGKIVTFQREAPQPQDQQEDEEGKEREEGNAAATAAAVGEGNPAAAMGPRVTRFGSLVGHEASDVILKVNQGDVTYLYASSEGLAQHSLYFDALFKHGFVEATDRIVEMNLPCIEMLEPTLAHLYTGEAPEALLLLPGGGGLSPELFFGLMSNAKFLLMERLVAQGADFLIRAVVAGEHEGFIHHPGFGPELVPAWHLLRLLQAPFASAAAATAEGDEENGQNPESSGGSGSGSRNAGPDPALCERALTTACAWLHGCEEAIVQYIVPAGDMEAVAAQCETVAAALSFVTLEALSRSYPGKFRRLISANCFLAALTRMEARIAEQAKRLQVQRCRRCNVLVAYGLKGDHGCVRSYHPATFIDGQPPFDGTWTCCHQPKLSAPGCRYRYQPHDLEEDSWVDSAGN